VFYAMSARSFLQRSRAGRVLFEIEESAIVVTLRRWGNTSSSRYLLQDLVPNYERVHVWHLVPLTQLCIATGCAILVMRFGLEQSMFPMGVIVLPGVIFSFIAILEFRRLIFPIEVVRFRQHQGDIAFAIVREVGQEQECDEFVREICLSIQSRWGSA